MSIVVHSLKDISRKHGMQKREPEWQNVPFLWVFCSASILISKNAGSIACW